MNYLMNLGIGMLFLVRRAIKNIDMCLCIISNISLRVKYRQRLVVFVAVVVLWGVLIVDIASFFSWLSGDSFFLLIAVITVISIMSLTFETFIAHYCGEWAKSWEEYDKYSEIEKSIYEYSEICGLDNYCRPLVIMACTTLGSFYVGIVYAVFVLGISH